VAGKAKDFWWCAVHTFMPTKYSRWATFLAALVALQACAHEICPQKPTLAPTATYKAQSSSSAVQVVEVAAHTTPAPIVDGSPDHRLVGHMAPLPEELLAAPIPLACGAVIRELRGGNIINLEVLNRLCSEVSSSFLPFLEAQGLSSHASTPFAWDLSFLPSGNCYRCLNDEHYRFRHRVVLDRELIGYTDVSERTIFLTSDAWDAEFRLVFAHELFHAFSIHHRLFADRSGTWQERYVAEEALAGDFTQWLGYGR
jgi:hypothetical protein